MCLQHPLPSSLNFAAGDLAVTATQGTIAQLEGFRVQVQGDGNLVGYAVDTVSGGEWSVAWASNPQSEACGGDGSGCVVRFGDDGDFVEDDGDGRMWDSGTSGEGRTVVFSNGAPYFEVLDADGGSVWTIADGVVQ